MTHAAIAETIKNVGKEIILVYAFNTTGKTRLCVAYKDATKLDDGSHAGVYYNAFSEDLFVWDNDEDNDGADVRLTVLPSKLSQFHSQLTEEKVREKLDAYKPKFGFEMRLHKNPADGIKSISFFIPDPNPDATQPPIKISRGEERIFVWCFFLALFDVNEWTDGQSKHIFIDDPVSSLDDHGIFITASTLLSLIEEHYKNRKIIVTTHHIGLFAILSDWLLKGEKASKFKGTTKAFILSEKSGELSLSTPRDEVLLYHLRLLQLLQKAVDDDNVCAFHFAMLRQLLESVASFLGVGRVGYVLEQIGLNDPGKMTSIINALSHKNVYHYASDLVVPDNQVLLVDVLSRLRDKYRFVLHAD